MLYDSILIVFLVILNLIQLAICSGIYIIKTIFHFLNKIVEAATNEDDLSSSTKEA